MDTLYANTNLIISLNSNIQWIFQFCLGIIFFDYDFRSETGKEFYTKDCNQKSQFGEWSIDCKPSTYCSILLMLLLPLLSPPPQFQFSIYVYQCFTCLSTPIKYLTRFIQSYHSYLYACLKCIILFTAYYFLTTFHLRFRPIFLIKTLYS